MRFRLVIAAMSVVLPASVGIEGYARVANLDHRQATALAVEKGNASGTVAGTVGSVLNVDYLPRKFQETEEGFETSWGACVFDADRPTVLVLGDSTTRQWTLDREEETVTGAWPAAVDFGDRQVCVLAENGFHPYDYARIYNGLKDRMKIEQVVILLCENDLSPRRSRVAVPDGDFIVFYEDPRFNLIVPLLWQPTLYDHSEAFRFLHYALGARLGGKHIQRSNSKHLPFESLSAIAETALSLSLFYLPPLGAEIDPVLNRPFFTEADLHSMADEGGLSVQVLSLPEDPLSIRLSPEDAIHLNVEGHAWVGAQISAALSL